MSETADLVVQVRTARCQPWCHTHSLDTWQAEKYDGVPDYWHYGSPVSVPVRRADCR